MGSSPSDLKKWIDSDFFKQGAFLSSTDKEFVYLAKGGSSEIIEEFYQTDTPVFYLKDFFQNKYLALRPASFLKVKTTDLTEYLQSLRLDSTHFSVSGNDDDLYKLDFESLKEKLETNLEKVVLVSRESYEGFEANKTIKHLIKKAFEFKAGWPYGFWNDSYGVIGSTPELLYEIKGPVLETFALAGTRKKGSEEELLNSKKDRHEHHLVVRDIREKLRPFVTDLAVYDTEIASFNSIIHLKTDIMARIIDQKNLTALTSTLSPTAALGGYPKKESLEFLKSSHYARKYYPRYFGSALGIISKEVRQFIVSIRNVQWNSSSLFIESGGGVVAGSLYEKELQEIYLKRETIRKHYL